MPEAEKHIDVKVKTRWFRAFYLMVWSVFAWAAFIIETAMMIKRSSIFWELLAIAVILFIAAFLTSTLVVWQFRGKVRIQFDKQALQIFNMGIPFKRRVQIPYRLVSRIIYAKDRNSMWGVTSGNIMVHYYGGSRKFGQDLSKEEATLLIRQIEERIKSIGNTTSELSKT